MFVHFFFLNWSPELYFIEINSEGASWIIILKARKRGYVIALQPYLLVDYLRKLTEDVKSIYSLHKFCGCCNQDTTQMKLSNKIFMCSDKYSDRLVLALS